MFNINETLKQNVISKIPAGYSPLETCVFVYSYLCSTLEYSIEYYGNEELYAPFFQNPKNLLKVDGVSYNKVVCYTFSAIFQTIIESLNLPNVKFKHKVKLNTKGVFDDYHDCPELKIGETVYDVDATTGVLMNNDLADQKFKNRPLQHFSLISVGRNESRLEKQNELDQAIEQVSNDLQLTKLAEQYVVQKGKDYKKLPLENRFRLFKELLSYTPDYSISSLNYLQTIKHALFEFSEYHFSFSKEKNTKQYFQISFVRRGITGEVIILVFYNPKGYNKACPNFDSLEIYEFSAKTKQLKNISRNTLYENIISQTLYEIDGYGNDIVCLDSVEINMAIDSTPL